GMRRNDDLVGAERAQTVLDRLQRIAVADLAARVEPGRREPRETCVQPLLRGRACAVLVGRPVSDWCVERGRDNEELGARSCAPLADHVAQLGASDRLVCGHESASLTWRM